MYSTFTEMLLFTKYDIIKKALSIQELPSQRPIFSPRVNREAKAQKRPSDLETLAQNQNYM